MCLFYLIMIYFNLLGSLIIELGLVIGVVVGFFFENGGWVSFMFCFMLKEL